MFRRNVNNRWFAGRNWQHFILATEFPCQTMTSVNYPTLLEKQVKNNLKIQFNKIPEQWKS